MLHHSTTVLFHLKLTTGNFFPNWKTHVLSLTARGSTLTFQAWIYHSHLHPLQAANCCRNSRLVVDEGDLKWVVNWRQLPCIAVKQFHGNFPSEILSCRKIRSVFRDVKWCFNASWGLKGLRRQNLTSNVLLRAVRVNSFKMGVFFNIFYCQVESLLLRMKMCV